MTAPVADLSAQLDALFLSDPNAIADPFPTWRRLRETAPVVEHGALMLVTRHEDIHRVTREPQTFGSGGSWSGSYGKRIRASLTPEQQVAYDEVFRFHDLFMVANDGDEHARLRRIAHRAFTPRRIAALQEATVRYVNEILDELEQSGEVIDLMQLAYRVPLMIIGDLLSVPEQDREKIKYWSDVWGRNRNGAEPGPLMDAYKTLFEFTAYINEMIELHRQDPGSSDLVGALLDAEEGEALNAEELAAMYLVLLFAGHETTTSLISSGALELLRHREQWQALCDDPSLAPAAVEELLRWTTPVQWTNRIVRHDTEVAGTPIEAGTTVFTMLVCANRDPDAFDDPETLDIGRADVGKHVALGFGTHFCLGASLARLEGAIALEALARRFPNVELAVPSDEIVFGGHAKLRRPVELPLRLNG